MFFKINMCKYSTVWCGMSGSVKMYMVSNQGLVAFIMFATGKSSGLTLPACFGISCIVFAAN